MTALDLGEAIRARREDAGFSQAQLARRLGVQRGCFKVAGWRKTGTSAKGEKDLLQKPFVSALEVAC